TELAARAKVGRRVVSEIENGKSSVQALQLFSVCLAADMELLVRREEPRSEPAPHSRPDVPLSQSVLFAHLPENGMRPDQP
uniref:hypothetical protein n=1 Tax=Sphingomonas bacterium TaxID=1895847 RepID=UPI002621CED1